MTDATPMDCKCGSSLTMAHNIRDPDRPGYNQWDEVWRVMCSGCGAFGYMRATKADAVLSWNASVESLVRYSPGRRDDDAPERPEAVPAAPAVVRQLPPLLDPEPVEIILPKGWRPPKPQPEPTCADGRCSAPAETESIKGIGRVCWNCRESEEPVSPAMAAWQVKAEREAEMGAAASRHVDRALEPSAEPEAPIAAPVIDDKWLRDLAKRHGVKVKG